MLVLIACEAVGMLVLKAVLSVRRVCAVATVGRRHLWLDALGYDNTAVQLFSTCSTAGNQGLCGCTADVLAKFKAEQTEREVVVKALAGCVKKQPAAPPAGAFRGRGSYAAANSANLLDCRTFFRRTRQEEQALAKEDAAANCGTAGSRWGSSYH